MKNLISSLLILALVGCTSIKVQQLESNHQLYHVCIQQNPKVIVKEFPSVIEKGFERHGITSEIYQGEKPKYCEYNLTYTAQKTWDIGVYLHHAELHLLKDNIKIAYAEYHLNGKGGLALNKWASVDSKMNPVISKLLANFSPEMVDAYRKSIDRSESSVSSKTEKLREIKSWLDEGLITEKEYNIQKKVILDK